MAKTTNFEWPVPDGVDNVDVPGDVLALGNAIDAELKGFDVAELGSAGAGDSGKLLIVQGTGAAAWKAMSGDATIGATGALSIGNLKVLTAMLAEQAITAAKIALLAVEEGHLKDESVAANKIKTFAVTAIKLASEAVETAKIANLAVTAAKLGSEAVETAKIKALAVTAAKLAAEAVEASKLAANAVETAKIKDGAVTDAKMASPNNAVQKILLSAIGGIASGASGGEGAIFRRWLGYVGEAKLSETQVAGSAFSGPALIYLDPADYEVAGKTAQLSIRATVSTNYVKPLMNFQFGLYPLVIVNEEAANNIRLKLEAIVAGTEVTINTPALKSTTAALSADFAVPAKGLYCLGLNLSATMTTNAAAMCSGQLRLRHT